MTQILLDIGDENISEIVRQELMYMYDTVSDIGNDPKMLKHLEKVVKFYSTEGEFNEWKKSRKTT
jgi:hypothetical protein